MSAYLEFSPGSAVLDAGNPPTEDNNGLEFASDGFDHICGWTKYVPAYINNLSTVTLRLYFQDGGIGAGVVRYDFSWFNIDSTGVVFPFGTHTELVTVPNVAGTLFHVDVDISSWFVSNPELLIFTMLRNSTLAGDTFAHEQTFSGARTL